MPRVGLGEASDARFCSRCPACPCDLPDCNADVVRIKKSGGVGMDYLFYKFVLDSNNHYIPIGHRPCWDCGEKSKDIRENGHKFGRCFAKCFVCKKCSHGGVRVVKLYKVEGRHAPDDYIKRAHNHCLKCPTCDAVGPGKDLIAQNDSVKVWGVREDDSLVHIPCGPCERPGCPNPSGPGAFERNGNLIVHTKHEREDARARALVRKQQREAERERDAALAPKKPALKRDPKRRAINRSAGV